MAETYEKRTARPANIQPFNRGVIPSANLIVIGGTWVGYIQNIDETQDRPVTPQYEVGSIGAVEILPGQPTYTLTLSKAAVYTKRLLQLFLEKGYTERYGETLIEDAIKGQMSGDAAAKNAEVFSLVIHNILPFEIQIWELNYGVDSEGNPLDFNFDVASKSKIKTRYVDCWISNTTKPIAQGNPNVVETMNVAARKITLGI